MSTHLSAPRRNWTLTRFPALAIAALAAATLALAPAAWSQSQPAPVQPTSQGTNQPERPVYRSSIRLHG